MNKHDGHYKGIEPIEMMEQIIEREMIPQKAALNIACAYKYVARAGLKGFWKGDIEKAVNYLHRAITGEWLAAKLDTLVKIEQLRNEFHHAYITEPDNEYLEGKVKATDDIIQLLRESK